MPTPKPGRDSRFLELFLSEYEDGQWKGELSSKVRPEAEIDGAVDMTATRRSDGYQLAIEHTVVEPFDGDKTDFHTHFKRLQGIVRSDSSLGVPGFFIHINLPVRVVPHAKYLASIAADIGGWIRASHTTFTDDLELRRCPCPHHPLGELLVQVSKVPLEGHPDKAPIAIQRYGEMRVGDSVEKALRRKLPKLVKTAADRRILMLERDQGWVTPKLVVAEVEAQREAFPALAAVDELWIMDTAAFGEPDIYVAFERSDTKGNNIERFVFYDGKMFEKFKNGHPVFVSSPDVSGLGP